MKKLVFTFLLLGLFCTNNNAQVVVKPGTWPAMCQGGGYVTQIAPIVIKETSLNDFGTGNWQAYEIAAPTGYQFSISSCSIVFYGPVGGVSFPSLGTGNYNLLFTVISVGNPASIDSIKITGLQVRALVGAGSPANVYRVSATDYPSAPDHIENGNMPVNLKLHSVLTSIPNPAPTISYTPDPYYCNKENVNNTLTATPAGGTWTGTGVTTNKFNAYTLAANTYTLTYAVINGGLCTNQSTVDVLVKTSPTVSLSSNDADNIICAGQSVTFTGASTGSSKRYQFFKNNIPVTALSASALYTTTTLANNDQITVVSDNGNFTCPDTSSAITMTVITSPNPTVSVSGLPAIICSNTTGTFPISTSPAGGTLTGSGISGSTFSPSLAGAGTYILTYSVVSGGCTFSATTPSITVIAAPQLSVTSSDADNIICKGDLVTLSVNTFGTTNTIYYRTNINSAFGPVSAMTRLYSNIVNGDVLDVKVTNSDGSCAVFSSSFAMTVGEIPKAYFKWQNMCGTNNVNYIDTSKITSNSIVQWNWDFDINSTTDINSVVQNPSYSFPTTGAYYTRLTVTSNYGCKDTLSRRILTLLSATVTTNNPYTADFNTSMSGWNYGDDSLTSWGWGTFNPLTPHDSTQIISNQNIWHTGNTPTYFYNTNERSFLNSPCFNLQGVTKPMIAIKMSMDTDPTTAGAMLEASKDGGVTWNRVGNMGDGVSWYNNSGNDGRPGGYTKYSNYIVWSGHYDTIPAVNKFSGWKVAKIKLDSLAGLSSVRFRIAFGAANSGVTKYTGIAIDSIWIGDRNKRLVLENFMNTYITNDKDGAPILAAKNAVDYIRDQRPKDVSAVYYDCSIPIANNVYNLAYPAGPSSRVLYYGVPSVPHTVLDGTYYNGNIYSGGTAATRLDVSDVDTRILERAKFRLDMTTILNAGTIRANVKIVYLYPYAHYGNDMVLQTVVVEDSAGGDNNFSSIVRKMLPDAAGEYISKAPIGWALNDSLTFTQVWNYGSLNSGKLGVVAFIQDAITHEVLQSVYIRGAGNSGSQTISEISDSKVENNSMLVYPNPADNEVNIVSLSERESIENWILYDNLGRELKKGTPEKFSKKVSFTTYDIANGIHCIKITDSKGNNFSRKILINH